VSNVECYPGFTTKMATALFAKMLDNFRVQCGLSMKTEFLHKMVYLSLKCLSEHIISYKVFSIGIFSST
jgi:hypothetical protein